MAKRDVDVTIKGKNETRKAFREVEQGAEGLGGRFGKLLNPINALKGAIAGLSAMMVGRFLADTVKSASEADAAWGRVESAVTNAGISFNLVRKDLDGLFLSIQKTTRYSDDAAADAFASLLSISNDYAGSLKNLTLVTDLAAAKKIDLKIASELVGKAMIGETGTLSRYGIIVKEGTDALEIMRDRFQGFANRDAKTMQGQLERVANAWDNVKESIGNALLGFDGAESSTGALTARLGEMSVWIDQNKSNLQDTLTVLTDILTALGKFANLTIVKPLAAVRRAATGDLREDRLLGLIVGTMARQQVRAEGGNPDLEDVGDLAYIRALEKIRKRRETEVAKQVAANTQATYQSPISDAERKAQDRAFEKLMQDIPTASTLRAQQRNQGLLGPDTGLKPLTDDVIGPMIPTLEGATEQIDVMTGSLGAFRDTLVDIGQNTVGTFASTWGDAVASIVTGAEKGGGAILKAFRKATGGSLMSEGQKWLYEAGAIAIKGFYNPVDWGRAAQLFGLGTAAIGAGAAIAGGGSGGGGAGAGLSGAGFSQQQREMSESRGTGTIQVIGGLLNMNDPRQRDALGDAINTLTGLRVIFRGESQ